MQIGLVGLGRMGANMSRRWLRDGHTVVGYARHTETVDGLVADKAISAGAKSLKDLIGQLAAPRVVWLMVPAASVDATLDKIVPMLARGDVVVDGGNSYYVDDIRRSKTLAIEGIHYLDCGTSGGVAGLERGYCLMIGGPAEAVKRLDPIFRALAPGVASAPRTPGRTGEPSAAENGYLHCGPSGAGHFVKMVHNGIECGLMAAYAEGLNILKHANAGAAQREVSAEITPLRDPDNYRVRPRSHRSRRGVAARQRRGLLAAGSDLGSVPGQRRPFQLRGPSVGLRRRALDEHRGHRRRRPGADPDHCAVRALHVSRRGRLRRSGVIGHEIRLRRARRAEGLEHG